MTNPAKLQHIRAQADMLGVKYHHRAGIEKIQSLIDAHLESQNQPEAVEPLVEAATREDVSTFPEGAREPVIPLSAEEYKKDQARKNRINAPALIRCRVQCMDPQKKNWPGEIISVGSAKLGTFKKYVPFDTEEPWHIPKIIYDMLNERKCSIFVTKTDDRGHKTKTAKQIKAYTITVEEPLTQEELKDLAHKQAIAATGN